MENRSASVRAVVLQDDRLLCVKLKNYQKAGQNDFWCLPGGGVNPGESVLTALKREIIEEIGVSPEIGRLLYVHQFKSDNKDILELFFHVTNTQDFLNIDLAKTSHGKEEIANVAFINPAHTHILPKFLTTEPLSQIVNEPASTRIFSYPD